MKTLELETIEAFLLCVALREYLLDSQYRQAGVTLTNHPSSKAIIEVILNRLDTLLDKSPQT